MNNSKIIKYLTFQSVIFLSFTINVIICQYQQQPIGIKTLYPALGGNRSNENGIGGIGVGSTTFYSQYRLNGTTTNNQQTPLQIFRNKTLNEIQSGVCYTEVPTSTLVKDPRGFIPAGNGSSSTLSRIRICCEGYERNIHNFLKCDPICSTECINGLCIAPNECRCFPDHVRNLAGICIPTCPIGCGNGICLSDGSCSCKAGYTLELNRKFCIPQCRTGCQNGNCTAPETCVCNKGYELIQNRCAPKCSGGCINGQCISPEVCSCAAGYLKVDNTCEPICSRGCASGKCVAPNTCSCQTGWILSTDKNSCIPHCEEPCLNGICSGPNKCTCHSGYIIDQYDQYKCIANCPNGCPNGVCSAPNFCLCKAGYVKDRSVKGSQNCVPRT